MINKLWTKEDVAKFLGVSPRQVSDRYAAHPDFPKPIRLPSAKGHGVMRWLKEDIMPWLEQQKKAA